MKHKCLPRGRNWCFVILDDDDEDMERLLCCEMCECMVACGEPFGDTGQSVTIGFMQFEKAMSQSKAEPCVGWKADLFRPRSVTEVIRSVRDGSNRVETGFVEDVRCSGRPLRLHPKGACERQFECRLDAMDVLCLMRAEHETRCDPSEGPLMH